MRAIAVLSLLMVAFGSYAASAAESDYADIDVISVVPRGETVKYFFAALILQGLLYLAYSRLGIS